MDGKYKSLVAWFGVALIVEPFLQLAQVEHVVKAGVTVGDHIENHVTVVLKSIHVMVDHHRPGVVLRLEYFASLSVYQMDESLWKKETFRKTVTVMLTDLVMVYLPAV